MCKQHILRDYLGRRSDERRRPFQRVFYVGDGANDVCPCLALGTADVAFARRDFPMHRILTHMQQHHAQQQHLPQQQHQEPIRPIKVRHGMETGTVESVTCFSCVLQC